MADAQTPQKQDEAQPPHQPAGPGLMMVAGLALLVVAVWCGKDFFFPYQEWKKEEQGWKIWTNGGGMLIALVLSAYCFVQAYIRNKQPKPAAAPKKPDKPGLV